MLEDAQKPIAIGPRIFDLQSSKQLTAGSPRLRSEPRVQLLSDLRPRVRSPMARFCIRLGRAVGREEAIEAAHAELLSLPQYSPDLNLIELFFS